MLFFAIFIACNTLVAGIKFDVLFKWKVFDYDWDCPSQRKQAMADGAFRPTQTIIYDIIQHTDGRWIVSLSEYDFKNPCSLATISHKSGEGGPLMEPYPDWDWHTRSDCSGISSVLRMTTDTCGRLWFVDTGRVGDTFVCPPEILVFDLATNKLVARYSISNKLVQDGNIEIHQVIIRGGNCADVLVIMTDLVGTGLIIFDGDCMWRQDCDFLKVGPLYASAGGKKIPVGSYGAGLVRAVPDELTGDGIVMAASIAYGDPAYTSIENIRGSKDGPLTFYTNGMNYSGQILSGAFSEQGIFFSGWMNPSSLRCVNMANILQPDSMKVLETDDEKFNTMATMRITRNLLNRESLWFFSNSYMDFTQKNISTQRDNFVVYQASVDTLVRGTDCKPTTKTPFPTLESLGLHSDKQYECRKTAKECSGVSKYSLVITNTTRRLNLTDFPSLVIEF